MDVLARLAVALVGALAGAVIGGALAYALLFGGDGADALTLLALGFVLFVSATVGGALAAGPLLGRRFGRVGPEARPGYAIGAALVVVVLGPTLAIDLAGSDDDFVFKELICRGPGVLYASDPFDTETLEICLTTTRDLRTLQEVGWRFGPESGCPEASNYVARAWTIPGTGRIDERGFRATIRRARASGVLEDSENCPGKSFRWTAPREASSP